MAQWTYTCGCSRTAGSECRTGTACGFRAVFEVVAREMAMEMVKTRIVLVHVVALFGGHLDELVLA